MVIVIEKVRCYKIISVDNKLKITHKGILKRTKQFVGYDNIMFISEGDIITTSVFTEDIFSFHRCKISDVYIDNTRITIDINNSNIDKINIKLSNRLYLKNNFINSYVNLDCVFSLDCISNNLKRLYIGKWVLTEIQNNKIKSLDNNKYLDLVSRYRY